MRARRAAGMTLPELMVVQFIMVIMGVFLMFLYDSAYVVYDKGTSRMNSTQRAREALRRVAPLIGSAVPPQVDDRAINTPATYGAPSNTLVLYGTAEYVYTNAPPNPAPTPTAFNPASPTFSRYRVRWLVDPTINQSDPDKAPGGRIGNLVLDPDTVNTDDDRIIARGLYDCTFTNNDNNTILVQLDVYDNYRTAANRNGLVRYHQETTVFVPFFTWK